MTIRRKVTVRLIGVAANDAAIYPTMVDAYCEAFDGSSRARDGSGTVWHKGVRVDWRTSTRWYWRCIPVPRFAERWLW